MTLLQLDASLFRFINALPHDAISDSIASGIHYATRYGLIYVPIALVLIFTKKPPYSTLGRLGLTASIITYIVTDVMLKNVFQRPRPYQALTDVVLLYPTPHSFSFPSGQTAIAFVIAMGLWLMFPKKWIAYAGLAYAITIGLSRIYMGHHYPADVIAGACIGILASYLVFSLRQDTRPNPR